MKQLIVYDTRDGKIIDVSVKPMESYIVLTGIGTIEDGIVTSNSLIGVDEKEIIQLYVESTNRKLAYSNLIRLSDNSLDTRHKTFHSERVEVALQAFGLRPASKFSESEKDEFKNRVIDNVGHSNLNVLAINTDIDVGPATHEVNLSTGKIQRKDDIKYE